MTHLRSVLSCWNFKDSFRSLLVRPKGHLTPFDGIRGIGILIVVMFHGLMGIGEKVSTDYFQDYLANLPFYLSGILQGDKAVDSFFVLSGFLIGVMLMREHSRQGSINYRRFYGRRFLRLMPVYYLLILMLFFMPSDKDKIYLIANIFYVNNFLPSEGILAGWTWSLAVEEQFYFLFPVVLPFLLLKVRRKWLVFVVLSVLALVIRYVLLLQNPDVLTEGYVALMHNERFFSEVYDNLYSRYGAVLCGVIAAYYQVFYPHHIEQFFKRYLVLSNIILVISLIIMLAIYTAPVAFWIGEEYRTRTLYFHVFNRSVFSMSLTYIILAALHGEGLSKAVNAVMSARLWFPLAQLSYSMYLFNPGFMMLATVIVAKEVGAGAQFELIHLYQIFAIGLLGTVIFSIMTFVLLEKPFMNLRNVYAKVKAETQVDIQKSVEA